MKKRLIVIGQLVPVVISLLVLAAHCARSGSIIFMFLSIALAFGLFIREPFLARTVQLVLLLSTIEWLRFAYVFASARVEAGQPWTRLVLISGGIALLTFASIFMFYTKTLKEMYHLDENINSPETDKLETGEGEVSTKSDTQSAAQKISKEFLEVHNKKILLNALSPFSFLLMDFFMGGGIIALIWVGFTNNSLRRKMKTIGGKLSSEEKKRSFFRQMIPMLCISGGIMVYFYLSMPTPIIQKITISVVAGYALLMSAFAYFEYLYKGQKS